MAQTEFQAIVEECKALIFKNGTWEQIQVVRHVGELMIAELEIPEYIQDTFYATLADLLADVYQQKLKWMSCPLRELTEEQVAITVWMQTREDLKGRVWRDE